MARGHSKKKEKNALSAPSQPTRVRSSADLNSEEHLDDDSVLPPDNHEPVVVAWVSGYVSPPRAIPSPQPYTSAQNRARNGSGSGASNLDSIENSGQGSTKALLHPQANVQDRFEIGLNSDGTWFVLEPRERLQYHEDISREIRCIIKNNYNGAYRNWSMVPTDQKQLWNRMFKLTFKWDPAIQESLKEMQRESLKKGLKDLMHNAKRSKKNIQRGERSDWIRPHIWDELGQQWKSPEFIRRSDQSRTNRKMGDDWTHTTGPRTFTTVKMKKAKELGRQPLMSEWLTSCKQTKRNPNAPEGTPQSQLQEGWKDRIEAMDEASRQLFGTNTDRWPDHPDPRVWNAAFEKPVNKGKFKLAPRFNPTEGGFTPAPRYHPQLQISEGGTQLRELERERQERKRQRELEWQTKFDKWKENDKKKDKQITKLKKKLAPMSKMLRWFKTNVEPCNAQTSNPPTVETNESDDSDDSDQETESDHTLIS